MSLRTTHFRLFAAIALVLAGAWFLAFNARTGHLWGVIHDATDAIEDTAEAAIPGLGSPRVEPPEGSPFEEVTWGPGSAVVHVRVGGSPYRLLAINGWEIAGITAFAARQYKDKAQRRFEEDLVQLMTRAGRTPGETVTLRLQPPDGGEIREIEASLSWENRERLRSARIAKENTARSGARPDPKADVSSAEDPGSIIELAELLATRDSYAVAKGSSDILRRLARDFIASNPQPSRHEIAREQHRLIGTLIDGHASTDAPADFTQGPWLPMLLVPLGDAVGTGIVGIMPDRSGFIGGDAPFITAIGEVPIEELLLRQYEFIVDGSPALVRERACRMLRSAVAAGLAVESASVTIEVAETPDAPRERWKQITLPLSRRAPAFGTWPPHLTGMRDGGIAYLRLAEMGDGDAFLAELRGHFRAFAGADRLIIDVRGNGGGRRDALLLIASLIMPSDSPPIVYNASRPLRLPDEKAGDERAAMDQRMSERFMRLADDPVWSAAERAAIDRFRAGFEIREPGLTLDDDRFGPWYYGVVSPATEGSWWKPARRVTVLLDNACFSATDAWLTAMDQISGVTLLGRPSAGGSGLAITHRLSTGARIRLSSMVSLTADGVLLDGRGVQPDVVVWPQPGDFLRGGSDSVLDRAIELMNPPAR